MLFEILQCSEVLMKEYDKTSIVLIISHSSKMDTMLPLLSSAVNANPNDIFYKDTNDKDWDILRNVIQFDTSVSPKFNESYKEFGHSLLLSQAALYEGS